MSTPALGSQCAAPCTFSPLCLVSWAVAVSMPLPCPLASGTNAAPVQCIAHTLTHPSACADVRADQQRTAAGEHTGSDAGPGAGGGVGQRCAAVATGPCARPRLLPRAVRAPSHGGKRLSFVLYLQLSLFVSWAFEVSLVFTLCISLRNKCGPCARLQTLSVESGEGLELVAHFWRKEACVLQSMALLLASRSTVHRALIAGQVWQAPRCGRQRSETCFSCVCVRARVFVAHGIFAH